MNAVEVREGRIFWRGCFIRPEDADRLAVQFEAVSDWFRSDARNYARQLRAGLRQVQPMEKAA